MSASVACFHCGQAAGETPRWTVTIDGAERAMCCAGCQAVARAIRDAGLHDYYRQRAAPAAAPSMVPAELQELRLYDEPEIAARYVRDAGDVRQATLLLDGLRCGACAWLVERTLAAQPGVVGASVNFATERVVLRWDPARAKLSRLLAAIGAIGYRALPYDPARREAQLAQGSRQTLRRLFVAGIAMMQVMMYAFPGYTTDAGQIEPEFVQLMRWASLALTIPVMLYSALPFFGGALRDLRSRTLGMDVPVALGLGAAFAASAWATVSGEGEVYFDSVTMFVFLLLGARHLELLARRRASAAVDAISASLPERVTRLVGKPAGTSETCLAAMATEQVPAARVAPGDLLRVAAGERFAVDARIVAGSTAIDQSLLTGESAPLARGSGDEVPGGAVNAGSPVWIRALRASADSTLSTIERLVERAALDRPPIALAADRVAAWFVLGLLAFAAATALAWSLIDPSRVVPVAIAVLVVSCPCALSLATPAALAVASGAATRRGILVTSGRALEAIARCSDVVFDKTGTLTSGRPALVATRALSGRAGGEALRVAAALGAGSSHPLAAALADAAAARRDATAPVPAATEIRLAPGLGVEGSFEGRDYRLGSAGFAREWAPLPASAAGAHSEVWLVGRELGALARFELHDALRPEAAAAVDALRGAGIRVHLLSGDRPEAVAEVAAALRIDAVRAGATPAAKLEYVRGLQASGARVLMVGDGVNDAPVLGAADASLAVGDATALARTAADTVLLASDLRMIPELLGLARRTRAVIVQNLAWASAYNAIAIPAAAMGWVAPWLAALGMSASSLLVVGNALRLRVGARPRSAAAPAPDRPSPVAPAAPGGV